LPKLIMVLLYIKVLALIYSDIGTYEFWVTHVA
jgi:hypothetical protein